MFFFSFSAILNLNLSDTNHLFKKAKIQSALSSTSFSSVCPWFRKPSLTQKDEASLIITHTAHENWPLKRSSSNHQPLHIHTDHHFTCIPLISSLCVTQTLTTVIGERKKKHCISTASKMWVVQKSMIRVESWITAWYHQKLYFRTH